ncbi:hypothetical protein D3C72_2388530 [compost metagenome]
MKKPAASWRVPGCRNVGIGSWSALGTAGRIEKTVPTETLVSMFDEPSSGSMATASRASGLSETGCSSSSEA